MCFGFVELGRFSVEYRKVFGESPSQTLQLAQGHEFEALIAYQASLAIAERLAKSDPGNANRQRDFSVSRNKIGDIQVAQRHLPEALSSYQAGLAIRERLGNPILALPTGNAIFRLPMKKLAACR
jgi:hypothetical protein